MRRGRIPPSQKQSRGWKRLLYFAFDLLDYRLNNIRAMLCTFIAQLSIEMYSENKVLADFLERLKSYNSASIYSG